MVFREEVPWHVSATILEILLKSRIGLDSSEPQSAAVMTSLVEPLVEDLVLVLLTIDETGLKIYREVMD